MYIRESMTENEEEMVLYFTYESEKEVEELIEGGKNEKVTNKNKEFYIFALYFCPYLG